MLTLTSPSSLTLPADSASKLTEPSSFSVTASAAAMLMVKLLPPVVFRSSMSLMRIASVELFSDVRSMPP